MHTKESNNERYYGKTTHTKDNLSSFY